MSLVDLQGNSSTRSLFWKCCKNEFDKLSISLQYACRIPYIVIFKPNYKGHYKQGIGHYDVDFATKIQKF